MDGKPGITLITPEETNAYQLGDTTIFYRRVGTAEQNRMMSALSTRRDRVDLGEFNRKLLTAAIKGWKGIGDPSGKIPDAHDPSGPADRAMVQALVERLPGAVIVELSNLTAAAASAEEDVVKN